MPVVHKPRPQSAGVDRSMTKSLSKSVIMSAYHHKFREQQLEIAWRKRNTWGKAEQKAATAALPHGCAAALKSAAETRLLRDSHRMDENAINLSPRPWNDTSHLHPHHTETAHGRKLHANHMKARGMDSTEKAVHAGHVSRKAQDKLHEVRKNETLRSSSLQSSVDSDCVRHDRSLLS